VQEADSGRQALQCLQSQLDAGQDAPEAVFVDSRMPDMDGKQLVRLARQLYEGQSMPRFILLTGDNREALQLRSEGRSECPDGIAVKPLTAAMFAHALDISRSDPINAPESAALQEARAASGTPLAGMRVLLVEDNPINQQVAFELLTAQGALVTLADNGLEGLNAIRAANPWFDVVLMDLQMPVMDGLSATRLLREDPRFAALPVIAMTANAMDTDRTACIQAGMNDHVGKPFDLKNLVEKLVQHTHWQAQGIAASSSSVRPIESEVAAGPEPLPMRWPKGLEIDVALARMGGNQALLQRAIKAFVADVQQLAVRLEELLNRGAREDAKRELHAVKGLAATLGATELSKLAAAVEKAVVDQPRNTIDTMLADIARHLETVLPDLESVMRALAPPANSTVAGISEGADKSAVAEGLQHLLKALQASDMEAMVLHAELRQKVDDSVAQKMAGLDAAMAEMELDEAAVECERLLQQL
jgi:CheY-like chemotaxis protein